jgi:hypothetical protein
MKIYRVAAVGQKRFAHWVARLLAAAAIATMGFTLALAQSTKLNDAQIAHIAGDIVIRSMSTTRLHTTRPLMAPYRTR